MGDGKDPDGNLTVAEYTAKHSDVVAKASKAEDGVKGGGGQAPPFGKGAPPKADDEEEDAELAALANVSVLEMAGALRRGPVLALQDRYVPVPPMLRYTFAGLPIAVENRNGTTRVWRDKGPDGDIVGQVTMRNDYGYIEPLRLMPNGTVHIVGDGICDSRRAGRTFRSSRGQAHSGSSGTWRARRLGTCRRRQRSQRRRRSLTTSRRQTVTPSRWVPPSSLTSGARMPGTSW